jgi:hypothetical protein
VRAPRAEPDARPRPTPAQVLQRTARTAHDHDALMEVAFNGLGSMPHRMMEVRGSAEM